MLSPVTWRRIDKSGGREFDGIPFQRARKNEDHPLSFRASISNRIQPRHDIVTSFPRHGALSFSFVPRTLLVLADVHTQSTNTHTLAAGHFALTVASSEKKIHAINGEIPGKRVCSHWGESPGIVGRTNAKRVPKIEMKLVSEEDDSLSSPSRFKSTVSTSHQVDEKPEIPRTPPTTNWTKAKRAEGQCQRGRKHGSTQQRIVLSAQSVIPIAHGRACTIYRVDL